MAPRNRQRAVGSSVPGTWCACGLRTRAGGQPGSAGCGGLEPSASRWPRAGSMGRSSTGRGSTSVRFRRWTPTPRDGPIASSARLDAGWSVVRSRTRTATVGPRRGIGWRQGATGGRRDDMPAAMRGGPGHAGGSSPAGVPTAGADARPHRPDAGLAGRVARPAASTTGEAVLQLVDQRLARAMAT